MVVNFEFLDDEPIENLITCMNFAVDKVVFMGYIKTIDKMKKQTEAFLKKYCKVDKIVFITLSKTDLQSTLDTMRSQIEQERRKNNQIYFDITGGEDLILVAFGMLSKEFETPMHLFDIASGKLIELDERASHSIKKEVQARKMPMSLDLLIEMHGGLINTRMHKESKDIDDCEFASDIEKIYQIEKENFDHWNQFSEFLKSMSLENKDDLKADIKCRSITDLLKKYKINLFTKDKLDKIIDELSEHGILLDVERSNEAYSFRFKNKKIKDSLWEGGFVLEMYTYITESEHSDDCSVGVHIDWDGEIHENASGDVCNEIDVLSLKGYIPTFISCKSGILNSNKLLHALYELQTIADRFGGKYAKKILVVANEMQQIYRERASEMGIEVRKM